MFRKIIDWFSALRKKKGMSAARTKGTATMKARVWRAATGKWEAV
jgi:hypothetical protein